MVYLVFWVDLLILLYHALIIWQGVHRTMPISKMLTWFIKQYEKIIFDSITINLNQVIFIIGKLWQTQVFQNFNSLWKIWFSLLISFSLKWQASFVYFWENVYQTFPRHNNHNMSVSHTFKKNDSPLEKEEVASFITKLKQLHNACPQDKCSSLTLQQKC